jgi:hypothetical protein
MNWPGVERIAQKLSHRFDAVRFDVSLREADFVILGVNRDSIDELTFAERLLFLHPGKNGKVRLYAIMCVKGMADDRVEIDSCGCAMHEYAPKAVRRRCLRR